MDRSAYIVVHGAGGCLYDTFRLLLELSNTPCSWYEGEFYVPKSRGIIIRKLLGESDDRSPLFMAIQKQVVASLLKACNSPKRPQNLKQYTRISENRLLDDFPEFAIPFGPESRQEACQRLKKEGRKQLIDILSEQESGREPGNNPLRRMMTALRNTDGTLLPEQEAIAVCRIFFRDADMVNSIIRIRDMMEVGGDLDTVASSVFYAQYLIRSGKKAGRTCEYGRDYRFVFVNYHEGLRGLVDACEPSSDIYMADMPISTIPDLEGDLRFLQNHGICLKRYEDHHPYNEKHLKMLQRLKGEGLIEFFAMSGPLEGAEQEEEEMKCGADMVYEALIEGEEWETGAMKHLCELTHGEDFASNRQPLGILITELIKGGINKVELAQTLVQCQADDDIERVLREKGWEERIQLERKQYAEISDRYMEHVRMLEIKRTDLMDCGGPAYGTGSDMPLPVFRQTANDGNINVLAVLAPKTERHEPKLNIGRACEYFRKNIPETDYLLFCYGSNLIVGRRLNQADASLNLATIMKRLGTEDDGGHAGAAVCSPQNNPNYPHFLLGNVSGGSFPRFCRYLCSNLGHILETEVRVKSDLSVKSSQASSLTQGGGKLLYVIVAAFVIGMVYLMVNKEYRTELISKLNKDFFPWISIEDTDQPGIE